MVLRPRDYYLIKCVTLHGFRHFYFEYNFFFLFNNLFIIYEANEHGNNKYHCRKALQTNGKNSTMEQGEKNNNLQNKVAIENIKSQ